MATIGALNIMLTAQTGGFSSALGKAQGMAKSFSSGISSTTSKVIGFGSAILGAAAGGGVAFLVHKSMEGIDANAKLADSFGDTTQGITGLQYAAGLAGADNETLNKGLGKMVANLGEARNGSVGAAKAFNDIGLNFNTLAAMKPSEAFAAIADGINSLPSPADRAAAAMSIFGKSGLALLPTLASGSAGIAATNAEAEKLGITFSRVDAAKVEAANDAMTKVGQMIMGIANQIAIQLAPFVTDLANRFIAVGTSGSGMASMVATAIDWIIKGIGFVADYGVRPLIIGFEAIGWAFLKSASFIWNAVDKVGQKLVDLINLVPFMHAEWTSAYSDMAKMADGAADSVGKSLADNIFAPPPSEAINGYVNGVRDAAQKAAEIAAGAAPKNMANASNMTGTVKPIDLPKALVAGSAEAISFIHKQAAGGMNDPQQQIVNLNKQQLDVQRQQLAAMKDIANNDEEVVDF